MNKMENKNLEEIFCKEGKFLKTNGDEAKNLLYVGELSRCGELTKLNHSKIREIVKKSKREFHNDFNVYLVEESTMSPGLLSGVCSKLFNYSLKFYKI